MITQAEFVRTQVSKKGQLSWLLGAGTSVSAGMPTATELIWDLKKRYYCSEENREFLGNDIQLSPIKAKIQSYMESKGFPQEWDDSEYSFYFGLLFGDDYGKQRDYLREVLSTESISISSGQKALAGLIETGYLRCIFTTNFDEVVETSFARVAKKAITTFHLEGSSAAVDELNNEKFPFYVKLHGDFRYKSLMNLEEDLKEANKNLGQCFKNSSNRFGLFVVGYSGRDDSVMSLIDETLEGDNPFPHGLYWATLKGHQPPQKVQDILEKANSLGVETKIVEIVDFVALTTALWKQLPNRPTDLDDAIFEYSRQQVHLPLPCPGKSLPIIRFNAFKILDMPSHAYKVHLNNKIDWKKVNDLNRRNRGRMIAFIDDDLYAWGKITDLENIFGSEAEFQGSQLDCRVETLLQKGALKGALEEALAFGLATNTSLNLKYRRKSKYLVLPIPSEQGCYPELEKATGGGIVSGYNSNILVRGFNTELEEWNEYPLSWAEAVQVGISTLGGFILLTVRPDIWISPPKEREKGRNLIDSRVGNRKNDVLDKIFSAWSNYLFDSGEDEVMTFSAFAEADEYGKANFVVSTKTVYSKRI
ncbi:hypothetical protein F1728_25505 [Gimesia benthica]|uniref:Uncharacterized protein n=1 Tax=Gimesia benthica TaxID=2608982 RepID=A0A6I6AGR2_9PLAN|nr:SIR2 family protein [Gimesia benthica]QGQ25823.1 hypothetical protein F1728_25505 [Gimesia benthica]